MKPSIGRIVLYTLSEQDAQAINKHRDDFRNLKSEGYGDTGYVAHYGNEAHAGDEYPALIVRVWEGDLVNLSVQLDGTDTYWAPSRHGGEGLVNHWSWPPRV